MVARRITLSLALMASAALAVPAAQAMANPGPVAHSAGGGAPLPNPAVVGVAITRTDSALSSAADFIDQGNGAQAAKPLTAARRYLIRSYTGAKYLVAHPPPAPAAAGTANAATFRSQARRLVRSSHRSRKARSRWIRAHASGGAPAGPAFADGPTSVFNVLTSQYGAVTAAVGMYPDTTGALQKKALLVLNTSIILRNRLIKIIHAAEPAAPAAAGRVTGGAVVAGATYAPVMPGLTVLLDDEIQQMTAAAASSSLPQASKDDLNKAIAADQKIETQVNTWWPPVPAG